MNSMEIAFLILLGATAGTALLVNGIKARRDRQERLEQQKLISALRQKIAALQTENGVLALKLAQIQFISVLKPGMTPEQQPDSRKAQESEEGQS